MNDKLKLQPLYVINPIFSQERKVYIYGTDVNAGRNFFYCMNWNIYVHGFVRNDKTEQEHFFNKNIYQIEELDQDDVVIYQELKKERVKLYNRCVFLHIDDVLLVSSFINPQKIVIWGGGTVGRDVCKHLRKIGIEPLYFIDRNPTLHEIDGLYVYGPDRLLYLDETTSLILAVPCNDNMLNFIEKKHINCTIFIEKRELEYYKQGYMLCNKMVKPIDVSIICNIIKKKNLWLFVNNTKECQKMAIFLELMDIDFTGILYRNIDEPMMRSSKRRKILLEEILYEEDFYILFLNYEDYKILRYAGIYESDTCVCLINPLENIREFALEINCGNSYKGTYKFVGVDRYGDSEHLVLVTLGGSTTDGSLYPFSSWSEILYSKYTKKIIQVYNLGVAGYKSSNELLRLLQDVLSLKPQIIIVYDGYNDLSNRSRFDKEYPFAIDYNREIYDFAASNISFLYNGSASILDTPTVGYGIAREESIFDVWKSNIISMHAIAKAHGILFYSFFQPMLFSKKNLDENEKILKEISSIMFSKETMELMIDFQKQVELVEQNFDFLYNISNIFDYEHNVYFDHCHVKEKGNEIIADTIWKILMKDREFNELLENTYRKNV